MPVQKESGNLSYAPRIYKRDGEKDWQTYVETSWEAGNVRVQVFFQDVIVEVHVYPFDIHSLIQRGSFTNSE